MNSYNYKETSILDEYSEVVKDINAKFYELECFSNDALRQEINNIRVKIANHTDKEKALNENLVSVYAVVKEISRRFSLGDIEVSANEQDKYFAQKYDFVSIIGNKAIYKNTWYVRDMSYKWNMVHYDEQLLGGILLHHGFAVEMATGEGKTLVATLPISLNALSKNSVHVMTANDYLSMRDCEITRPLYMFLGLTVDCREYYNRGKSELKEAYQADIIFGTTSSFTFDYLFDNLATDCAECVQREYHFAIIDELDSMLIDDACTPHIVSGKPCYDNSQLFKDNFIIIKELLSEQNPARFYHTDKLRHEADFTQDGQIWLRNKIDEYDLFRYNRIYQIEGFESLNNEDKEHYFSLINRQNALQQLLYAMTVYEKDIDYVVDSGKILIIDPNTGRIMPSRRWEHGLHTAIEIKEGVNPKLESDGMGVISLSNYLKLYNKVAGMSGTIMAVAEELYDLYGLRSISLPTHKPNIRCDYPLRMFRSSKDKNLAIIETIRENKNNGRPTLVGCHSIKSSEALFELFSERGINSNLLNAKNIKDEAPIISKAGIGDTVTVSTDIAGRGTDIIPDKVAVANGGLMVIGAELSASVRIDQQLKGRTGRQGNPGSTALFASLEDTVLNFLKEDEKAELDNLVKKCCSQEISTSEISYYFRLAQINGEKHNRNLRTEMSRKDDIVAPRRLNFYKKRKEILYNPKNAECIINEVINSANLSIDEIDDNFKNLFEFFSELLNRSLNISPGLDKLLVPFSCQKQIFVLSFNVQSKKYDISCFTTELKQLLVLHTFDKYWKQFVLYILEDLDKKQIDGLDDKYNEMKEEINLTLGKLLQNAKIIFNPLPKEDVSPRLKEYTKTSRKKSLLHPDDDCPCGSGKKYCECHGRNIRNRYRVRR